VGSKTALTVLRLLSGDAGLHRSTVTCVMIMKHVCVCTEDDVLYMNNMSLIIVVFDVFTNIVSHQRQCRLECEDKI